MAELNKKVYDGAGIKISSMYHPTGAQPLDSRTVVQSLADLTTNNVLGNTVYEGMLVAVLDESQVYMLTLDRQEIVDTQTGEVSEQITNEWVPVGSHIAESVTDGEGNVIKPNGISLVQGKLWVPTYEIVETADGYAFTVDGTVKTTIGSTKDQFLENVEIITATEQDESLIVGDKYLKFTWKLDIDDTVEGDQKNTYVSLNEFAKTYTGDYNSDTQTGFISVSDNNVISLNTSRIATLVADIYSNRIDELEEATDTLQSSINSCNAGLAQASSTYARRDAFVSKEVNTDFNYDEDNALYSVNKDKVLVLTADISRTIENEEGDIDETVVYTSGDTIQSVLADLHARIDSINTNIENNLSGGVTSVSGQGPIKVTGTTTPTISLNIADESAIKVTQDDKLDIFWTEI